MPDIVMQPETDYRRELVDAGAAYVAARTDVERLRAELAAATTRRTAAKERRRKAIVTASTQGMPPGDIADAVPLDRTTVYHYLEGGTRA